MSSGDEVIVGGAIEKDYTLMLLKLKKNKSATQIKTSVMSLLLHKSDAEHDIIQVLRVPVCSSVQKFTDRKLSSGSISCHCTFVPIVLKFKFLATRKFPYTVYKL